MRPSTRTAFLATVIVSVAACRYTTVPEGGGTTNGAMVFMREDATGWFVTAINGDGSGQRDLTGPLLGLTWPALSADHSRIAYVSTASPAGIWVMKADGTGAHSILPTSDMRGPISWAPDGTQLAIAAANVIGDGGAGIVLVDSDGTNTRTLDTGQGDIGAPAWAPDGKHIAYMAGPYPFTSGIYQMNPDASNPTLIYALNNQFTGDPTWSPDGTRIAFAYGPPNVVTDGIGVILTAGGIAVVNADGTDARFLTPLDTTRFEPFDRRPTWSRDGQWIAFDRGQPDADPKNKESDIYVMRANGSRLAPLTNADGPNLAPSW